MKDKSPSRRVELLSHPWDEPSAFTPEALLDAVRSERNLDRTPVPKVCLLDFDGDLTDWLVQSGRTRRCPTWACFHTHMETFDVDGTPVGVIARTIGGPYTVLIAEQLAASGAAVIIGITSAGRVSPDIPIPALVVATSAIRDEGTSFHYLPPGRTVSGDPRLAAELALRLGPLELPVLRGPVWTTDAPYRETASQLRLHAAEGALAVEMQAASLFAFAEARGVTCGVVAHVTNGTGHTASSEQFDKGSQEWGFELFQAIARTGLDYLRGRQLELPADDN